MTSTSPPPSDQHTAVFETPPSTLTDISIGITDPKSSKLIRFISIRFLILRLEKQSSHSLQIVGRFWGVITCKKRWKQTKFCGQHSQENTKVQKQCMAKTHCPLWNSIKMPKIFKSFQFHNGIMQQTNSNNWTRIMSLFIITGKIWNSQEFWWFLPNKQIYFVHALLPRKKSSFTCHCSCMFTFGCIFGIYQSPTQDRKKEKRKGNFLPLKLQMI